MPSLARDRIRLERNASDTVDGRPYLLVASPVRDANGVLQAIDGHRRDRRRVSRRSGGAHRVAPARHLVRAARPRRLELVAAGQSVAGDAHSRDQHAAAVRQRRRVARKPSKSTVTSCRSSPTASPPTSSGTLEETELERRAVSPSGRARAGRGADVRRHAESGPRTPAAIALAGAQNRYDVMGVDDRPLPRVRRGAGRHADARALRPAQPGRSSTAACCTSRSRRSRIRSAASSFVSSSCATSRTAVGAKPTSRIAPSTIR